MTVAAAGPGIAFHTFVPLETALDREWLEPNGLGGWASSTVVGANTRRYHGLLVAALRPPARRFVLWSRSEEEVVCQGESFPISTNLYPGVVHPQGYRLQSEFALFPWPTFVYRCGAGVLRKSVFVEHERHTTCVLYENPGDVPLTLRVRPLMAFREYHCLAHANDYADLRAEAGPDSVRVAPYAGLPPIRFDHSGAVVEPSPLWYYRTEYPREQERGLEFQEDLFAAFTLTFEIAPGGTAWLAGTLEPQPVDVPAVAEAGRRRRRLPDLYPDPRANILAWSLRWFVVRRSPAGKSLIAGYPWFTDWGRDTMISLPGLMLTEGGPEDAREILTFFAQNVRDGLLPNCFADSGDACDYNTVDAALWFVHAIRSYYDRTGDRDTLRALLPAVREVVAGYRRGTRYGIRMDEDGLVAAGEPGTQLTWMDAKIDDLVVTPRLGKPVEINALWYHALRSLAELSAALGEDDDGAEALSRRVRWSFNEQFWNDARGCLFDVLAPDGPDGSIRPNQLFAVSLRPGLLPPKRRRGVLEVVRRHLLTPYGLRSLAPGDPHYRGRYEGDRWARDTAYHQGTVWPWLIGAYVDAYFHVHGASDVSREAIRELLEPLLGHVEEAGLGGVSEIFDGDPPHRPRGCPWQAWSAAELLRAYVRTLT